MDDCEDAEEASENGGEDDAGLVRIKAGQAPDAVSLDFTARHIEKDIVVEVVCNDDLMRVLDSGICGCWLVCFITEGLWNSKRSSGFYLSKRSLE